MRGNGIIPQNRQGSTAGRRTAAPESAGKGLEEAAVPPIRAGAAGGGQPRWRSQSAMAGGTSFWDLPLTYKPMWPPGNSRAV
ncbi:MAG: hypothetical protein OXU61_01125 [Gammaproteobacteria bacterium]|nr:hypothetical protein [Gammaproteobacteria bacterium]